MSAQLGPKSQPSWHQSFGWRWTYPWTFLLLIMSTFVFNPHAPSWQPEGSTLAIKGGGVHNEEIPNGFTTGTKLDGIDPIHSQAQHRTQSNPLCRKRAYLKALKRATLHGVTWYKGQYMTAQQLGIRALHLSPTNLTVEPPQPRAHLPAEHWSSNRQPSCRFRQHRLSFLSWNIGQLSMLKWDMFRAWLHKQHLDCICLQDTGWQFTGEWADAHFSYLHSGATLHRGGLLTIIRTGFCGSDKLAWSTPMSSRIQ